MTNKKFPAAATTGKCIQTGAVKPDTRPGGYEGRKDNEMRFSYYRFPDGTPENILLESGCGVILKSGHEIFPDTIPEDMRELVERVNDTFLCSITVAKQ